jgi:hypothetical protein
MVVFEIGVISANSRNSKRLESIPRWLNCEATSFQTTFGILHTIILESGTRLSTAVQASKTDYSIYLYD